MNLSIFTIRTVYRPPHWCQRKELKSSEDRLSNVTHVNGLPTQKGRKELLTSQRSGQEGQKDSVKGDYTNCREEVL